MGKISRWLIFLWGLIGWAKSQTLLSLTLLDSIVVPIRQQQDYFFIDFANDSIFIATKENEIDFLELNKGGKFSIYSLKYAKFSEYITAVRWDSTNRRLWFIGDKIHEWQPQTTEHKTYKYDIKDGSILFTEKDTFFAVNVLYKKLKIFKYRDGHFKVISKQKLHHIIDTNVLYRGFGDATSISFLNDSLLALSYLSFPLSYICNFRKNIFVDVLTNPLYEVKPDAVKDRLTYYPMPKIHKLQLATASTNYFSLHYFLKDGKRYYYQTVRFPNNCFAEHSEVDSIFDCLCSTPSKIVVWNENFQYVGIIDGPIFFKSIKDGFLYSYRNAEKNFVVYKYAIQFTKD